MFVRKIRSFKVDGIDYRCHDVQMFGWGIPFPWELRFSRMWMARKVLIVSSSMTYSSAPPLFFAVGKVTRQFYLPDIRLNSIVKSYQINWNQNVFSVSLTRTLKKLSLCGIQRCFKLISFPPIKDRDWKVRIDKFWTTFFIGWLCYIHLKYIFETF